MKNYHVFAIGLTLLLAACGNTNIVEQESTTRGKAKVGVDDAFSLLMEAESFAFQGLYDNAEIELQTGAEGELMDLMKNDSLRLLVIGRELTEDEIAYFKSRNSYPKLTKIAYDGLAFIVNKANPDTNISFEKLSDLFLGKASRWSDINPASGNDSIRVVFDHPRSGNARFLSELFGLQSYPANFFAVRTNEEVVNYVENNKSAIGIIGSNWISDPQDTVSHAFLDRIKVVGVSSKNDPSAALGYYKPYQGYIAGGQYPFKREVYMVSRELGVKVGTGFTAFVAGDKGQRIVLKSGMVPATAPVRLINVKSE